MATIYFQIQLQFCNTFNHRRLPSAGMGILSFHASVPLAVCLSPHPEGCFCPNSIRISEFGLNFVKGCTVTWKRSYWQWPCSANLCLFHKAQLILVCSVGLLLDQMMHSTVLQMMIKMAMFVKFLQFLMSANQMLYGPLNVLFYLLLFLFFGFFIFLILNILREDNVIYLKHRSYKIPICLQLLVYSCNCS